MMPRASLGIMLMWRWCFCVVALLAAPALAQAPRYDADHAPPRHNTQHRTDRQRGEPSRPGGLWRGGIDPYRMGPAPGAFLYHCDAPAGFYPYVPVCRLPWRLVPAGPRR
jgi:hypothetical protein